MSGKRTIWTDWVHKNLLKHISFWCISTLLDDSRCWRRILDQRSVAKDLVISILVGGEDTKMLTDLWYTKKRIIEWMDASIIQTGFHNGKVAEFIEGDHWNLPRSETAAVYSVLSQLAIVAFDAFEKYKAVLSVCSSGDST